MSLKRLRSPLFSVYLAVILTIPSPIAMSVLWPSFVSIHHNHPQIHLIENLLPALSSIAVFFFAFLNAYIIKRYGWKYSLILGLGGHAVLGVLSAYFFYDIAFYLIYRVFIGACVSLVIISTSTALANTEPNWSMTRLFAFQNISFGMGGALLTSFASWLDRWHWLTIHGIQSLTLIPLCLLIVSSPSSTQTAVSSSTRYSPPTQPHLFWFMALFTSAVIIMMISAAQYSFLPYHLAESLQFSPGQLAQHQRVYFIGEMIASGALFLFPILLTNTTTLSAGVGLCGASALLFFFPYSYPIIWLFTAVVGLSTGLLVPWLHVTIAKKTSSQEHPRFFGYLSSSFSLGELSMPFISFLPYFTSVSHKGGLLFVTTLMTLCLIAYILRSASLSRS